MLLNLFIAVIFEGFNEAQNSEDRDVIQKCVEVWKHYDPNYTMMIPLDAIFDFIDEVIYRLYKGPQGLDLKSSCASALNQAGPRWHKFDLHYMRIVSLQVNPELEVRFVTAVKAVLRRVVCQGGLNVDRKQERADRLRMLGELDQLDQMLLDDPPEMVTLARLERQQIRAIGRSLEPTGPCLPCCGGPNVRSKAATGWQESMEINLLEQVAAAKIQSQFKELIQRKRAVVGGLGVCEPRPMMRAAG